MPITHSVTIQNKRYPYTLKPEGKDQTFVECTAAAISQYFLNEDVPALILDLPNLILAEKEYTKTQSTVIRFRISPTDKQRIEKQALKHGYTSVSEYVRNMALNKQ